MTDCSAVPPGPAQLSENLLLGALKGPVLVVPLVDLLPIQLLFAGEALAVQLVTLAEVQVNVEAAPLGTESGLAASDTIGGCGVVTVTVTDLDTSPLAPKHVSVKALVAISGPVD